MHANVEDGVIHSPYPDYEIRDCSFYELIRESILRYSEKTLAIDGDIRMTGAEMLKKVQRCAAVLQRHGIQRGDLVCVHVATTLDNLIALFAVLATGATVVLSSPTLTTRELLYQIRDTSAVYVLSDSANSSKVREVQESHGLKHVFSTGSAPGFTNVLDFSSDSELSFKEHTIASPSEEVLAILYSSGSTGLPKGVEITHRNYVCALSTLRILDLLTEDDIHMAWHPITHVSGFTITTFSLLLGVTTVIQEPSATVEEFVKCVNKYKASFLFGFPVKLQAVMNHMEAKQLHIEPIQKIGVGGTAIPDAVGRRIVDVFRPVTLANFYGLSEALGMVTSTPMGVETYANAGVPVSRCQIKIVDTEKALTLGPDQPGEIWVRGPTVMKGYYRKPEATADSITPDGWLRTGDIAYYDNDGVLHVVDRLKEMIKCMDIQCVPAEVEEILMSHEGVAEVCVVGIPHPDHGEAPTAFVVLKESYRAPGRVKAQELQELVAKQSAVYKRLYGGVVFMDALPRTGNGKISKKELKMHHKPSWN